jgi:hypothetical protein
VNIAAEQRPKKKKKKDPFNGDDVILDLSKMEEPIRPRRISLKEQVS